MSTIVLEEPHPILVREPALPSLLGGGIDIENNVNTVEFKEWCQTEIDLALKVSSTVG